MLDLKQGLLEPLSEINRLLQHMLNMVERAYIEDGNMIDTDVEQLLAILEDLAPTLLNIKEALEGTPYEPLVDVMIDKFDRLTLLLESDPPDAAVVDTSADASVEALDADAAGRVEPGLSIEDFAAMDTVFDDAMFAGDRVADFGGDDVLRRLLEIETTDFMGIADSDVEVSTFIEDFDMLA